MREAMNQVLQEVVTQDLDKFVESVILNEF